MQIVLGVQTFYQNHAGIQPNLKIRCKKIKKYQKGALNGKILKIGTNTLTNKIEFQGGYVK